MVEGGANKKRPGDQDTNGEGDGDRHAKGKTKPVRLEARRYWVYYCSRVIGSTKLMTCLGSMTRVRAARLSNLRSDTQHYERCNYYCC